MTECIISTQNVDNITCDLGPAFTFIHYKLRDVPEMDYFSSNNQGELLVRGTSCFKGYYKQPELTAEAFDKDGYFATGDIVSVSVVNGVFYFIND